ncbi:UPF0223 family protein [Bacillus timonensis]|nr:UPF0223 family protein [Bacillus timonensis]
MEYQYPISYDWSTDEVIDVIKFFEYVEQAYEKGISKDSLLVAYRRLKEIVPSKSEEKQMFNEFEEMSGYSAYKIVKKARETEEDKLIKG